MFHFVIRGYVVRETVVVHRVLM